MPTSATPQHHSKESKNSELLAGVNSKEHVIDKSAHVPKEPGLISYLFGGQSSKKKVVDDVPGMYLDELEKADEEVNILISRNFLFIVFKNDSHVLISRIFFSNFRSTRFTWGAAVPEMTPFPATKTKIPSPVLAKVYP